MLTLHHGYRTIMEQQQTPDTSQVYEMHPVCPCRVCKTTAERCLCGLCYSLQHSANNVRDCRKAEGDIAGSGHAIRIDSTLLLFDFLTADLKLFWVYNWEDSTM